MTIVRYITCLELYNMLQDMTSSQLVIDTRSQDKYRQHGRVRAAINVNLENPDTQRRVRQGHVKVSEFSQDINFRMRGILQRRAVIYDDEQRDHVFNNNNNNNNTDNNNHIFNDKNQSIEPQFNDDYPADILAQELQKEGKLERIDILAVPFSSFAAKYPFLVSSDSNKAKRFQYASQIIEDFLYLGNRQNAHNEEEVEDLGITHIINTAEEIPNRFEDEEKVRYLTIGVGDTRNDSIAHHFDHAFKFIEEARESGGKVLIHCAMGISRSSTVTISYLMRRYQVPFDDCHSFVKDRRRCILPNPGFVEQLKQLESEFIQDKNSE